MVKANDAAHRQTTQRRETWSVAAAMTQQRGSAASLHDKRESAKAAGVKKESATVGSQK